MQSQNASTQSRDAVIAKRADDAPPDTEEVRQLAAVAGYDPVAEVTQTRPADSSLQFGRGKAEELAETVEATGAEVVVFDNDLTPTQTVELAALCPEETEVLDRHRLVLDIFEKQAGSKRATLQVERAKLEWNLPRIRESTEEQAMNKFTESGTRYYDVLDRIDQLDRKLADLGDDAAARRERRREEGFEFVALAGYTNAGKSTLLHRLADELDYETSEADHADLDATAEIEDRLFKTLDTTTRRATIDGRRTLVTDTVGFVSDLPHDLVASFHGTLSETQTADCVALVVDASDSLADLREKLETSFELLEDAEGKVVPVLNKADLLEDAELAERETVVREVTEAFETDSADLRCRGPVAVSAAEDQKLDTLRDRIAGSLAERRTVELVLPNDDAAMSVVSWLYDRASVSDVTYRDDEVTVEFEAKESIVEQAQSKAESLEVEA